MFSKVLIANRGEIAVRIIGACREMGLRSVAVYSDVDHDSLHVRLADESVRIGPAPALDSYLNIDAVMDAARASGADAVHPGYGFLAENAGFASAVVAAGLVWIGPSPDVIALMGDKIRAKEIAEEVGVRTIPGYAGEDQSPDRMEREASIVGYPVMLKAAAGGGGKGMRAVANPEDLHGALEGARREAVAAFGDGRLFIEKLLVQPRHIEIQVLADLHGTVVHLAERDCSIQRRHQKVVEEAPSPVMTGELRAEIGGAAVRIARSAGYVSAGTIEFLFAADQFYFLEMNTRIQVEHPVTEMVTGVDLIRSQFEIAAGMRLPFSQADVVVQGHAIEARIYAEDSDNGFLPSTGQLREFDLPVGVGVRNDVGTFRGATVSPYYDPMLAKLIAHGETRQQALVRLQQALDAYRVEGVKSNLPFLRWLARNSAFVSGNFDITFLDRTWVPTRERAIPDEVLLLAAVGEFLFAFTQPEPAFDPWHRRGGWRAFGSTRAYHYEVEGGNSIVELTPGPEENLPMTVNGRRRNVRILHAAPPTVELEVDGVRLAGRVDVGMVVEVTWEEASYQLRHPVVEAANPSTQVGGGSLSAPMPGTVVKVLVAPGQQVDVHEPLMVLEAMKMEHVIEAPFAAVVREIFFAQGDMVSSGVPVVRLEQP